MGLATLCVSKVGEFVPFDGVMKSQLMNVNPTFCAVLAAKSNTRSHELTIKFSTMLTS